MNNYSNLLGDAAATDGVLAQGERCAYVPPALVVQGLSVTIAGAGGSQLDTDYTAAEA